MNQAEGMLSIYTIREICIFGLLTTILDQSCLIFLQFNKPNLFLSR